MDGTSKKRSNLGKTHQHMVGIEHKTPDRRSNANHGKHHPMILLGPLLLTVTVNSKMRKKMKNEKGR
jgi:hypothetical protein